MFKLIDRVNEKIGNIVCFVIILIMFTIGTATISRYFFNEPLTVVWPVIRQLFGIFVLLGAAYTLLNDRHIRVEILYDHFPGWMRSVSRVITLVFFLSFIGILTWQGVSMARISIMLKETTSLSRFPIYPFKVLMPIATLLFLIQGLVFYLRSEKQSNEDESSERQISDVPEQSNSHE